MFTKLRQTVATIILLIGIALAAMEYQLGYVLMALVLIYWGTFAVFMFRQYDGGEDDNDMDDN